MTKAGNTEPTRFAGAWNWRRAVISSDLPPTTKHILLTLACHASEAGEGAFPFLGTLAEETSLNKQTVKRHLKAASGKGWIVREKQFKESGLQTANLYQLTAPIGGVSKIPGGTQDTGVGGTQDTPPGGTQDTPHRLKGQLKGQGKEREQGDLLGDHPPIAKKNGRKNGKKRGVPLPSGWRPTQEHIETAKEKNLDLDEEATKFRLHAAANGRTQVEWNSAFAMWLINAKNFARNNGSGNGSGENWESDWRPEWMGGE